MNAIKQPTTFQWTVGDPDAPVTIGSFEVADGPAGAVLTLRARLGPSHSPVRGAIEADPSSERRVAERRLGDLSESMQKVIEGIKARAESGR